MVSITLNRKEALFVPVTHKLYYDDLYCRGNESKVISAVDFKCAGESGEEIIKTEIVLEATCFYPEGGGQLSDRGLINGIGVEWVYERKNAEGESEIVHRLCSRADIGPGDKAVCELDFAFRFQNMQDHTSQHILSESFIRTAGLHTVSMHMGSDYMTIDLVADKNYSPAELKNFKISDAVIDEAEALANSIVHQNLKVVSFLTPASGLDKYSLRKRPALEDEMVRLVSIEGFDNSLCCGTHLANTGEAGVIKITGRQKANNSVRVKFVSGMKALSDYRRKNYILLSAAEYLSADYCDLLKSVEKLNNENKTLAKRKSELFDSYYAKIAEELSAGKYLENGIYWLESCDITYAELSRIAQICSKASGNFSFVMINNEASGGGMQGGAFRFIIGRAKGGAGEVKKLFATLAERFNIKGGGSELIVQGGNIENSKIDEFKKIVKEGLAC